MTERVVLIYIDGTLSWRGELVDAVFERQWHRSRIALVSVCPEPEASRLPPLQLDAPRHAGISRRSCPTCGKPA